MTHLSHEFRLIFTNSDIEVIKEWSGRQVGRAEFQEDAWLLIAYPDVDSSREVEIGYVTTLQDIVRWINKGAPADWKDSALSR